jgi:hypothetical protein
MHQILLHHLKTSLLIVMQFVVADKIHHVTVQSRSFFLWATDRRAKIHNLNHLLQNGIFKIMDDVQCNSCKTKFQMSFDLAAKFDVISQYLVTNMNTMHDRALGILMNPILPRSVHCNHENNVKYASVTTIVEQVP